MRVTFWLSPGTGQDLTMPGDVGYARSKVLGAFAFFDVSSADAAYLWSALVHIDAAGLERVNVADFAEVFCPTSAEVLVKIWDKYSWFKPTAHFKASVVHVDEDDLEAHVDIIEEDIAVKERERHLKEIQESNTRLALKNMPTYASFVGFLFFFMSTSEKMLPRWLYWLWFDIQKKRPTVESLLAAADDLWPKSSNVREQYLFAVKKSVRIVDSSFDAATFAIANSQTGGSFTRPALMVKAELRKTLGGGGSGGVGIPSGLWNRISASTERALADLGTAMERLEDKKLKGTPPIYSSKGERKQTRREVRRFLAKYAQFTAMKVNEEALDAKKGTLLPLLKSIVVGSVKTIAGLSKKVDLSSKSDFVRRLQVARKLANWHARRREEDEKAKREAELLRERVEKAEHQEVPLEWKYRKQLKLSREVLEGKAGAARVRALDSLQACDEIVPVKEILLRVAGVEYQEEEDDEEEEEEEDEGGATATGTRKVDEDDDDEEDE